jgi:FAD/FMN-containing dehydrogenase
MGDALGTLAGQLGGELLLPDDHGYDDARRGYNSLHDRRPAVVVRPADGGDVARALGFATSAGLEVAVRSGGHSLAGHGATEGGVLIDLSAMRAIAVDAGARVAWVEAGTFHRNLNIRPFQDGHGATVG